MNANRPNVIVFFTDQQRWDTTGAHGNPMGLTPHFDRMAAQGTHCASAFTCQPVCLPARASLQTGMYASQLGCHDNSCELGTEFPALGTLFAQGGYHTGYIGKWHLATASCSTPRARP
jgi:arylsulfatase A-like enzyme